MPTTSSPSSSVSPVTKPARSCSTSGKPAVAIASGLALRKARIGDVRIGRRLLRARVVPLRGLVEGIAAPALAVLMLPGADRDDDARAVAGTDDHVVHPGRAVDEIPLPQRVLLALGDEQRLTLDDEEVLLVGLPVVHRHRVTGVEHEDVDADLLELRFPVEAHDAASRAAVVPDDVAGIDDEPALARRDEAVLRLFQPGLGNHRAHRLTEMQTSLPVAERPRRPEWMKVRAPRADSRYFDVKKLIHGASLHTICEEARCPNIGECWGRGTATFQILGDVCTRACRYCAVTSGRPEAAPEPLEPLRVARAVERMGLDHVVVTSVDRDDLPDRGAAHFAATIRSIRRASPACGVEVLVPDFLGFREEALRIVLEAAPDVFNHNIETAEHLYRRVRPRGDYQRALDLLDTAKDVWADLHPGRAPLLTKSGLIVGMGESDDDVLGVMRDLRDHRVDVVTIGQ